MFGFFNDRMKCLTRQSNAVIVETEAVMYVGFCKKALRKRKVKQGAKLYKNVAECVK